MPLRMARPMRRTESSFIQFRQRIPADVLAKARGLNLVVPVGDQSAAITIERKAQDVKVSLRTRDPDEAKERQGQVGS